MRFKAKNLVQINWRQLLTPTRWRMGNPAQRYDFYHRITSYIDLRLPQRFRQRNNGVSNVGKESLRELNFTKDPQKQNAQNRTTNFMEIQLEKSVKNFHNNDKILISKVHIRGGLLENKEEQTIALIKESCKH